MDHPGTHDVVGPADQRARRQARAVAQVYAAQVDDGSYEARHDQVERGNGAGPEALADRGGRRDGSSGLLRTASRARVQRDAPLAKDSVPDHGRGDPRGDGGPFHANRLYRSTRSHCARCPMTRPRSP